MLGSHVDAFLNVSIPKPETNCLSSQLETVGHVRRGATYEMMTDLNPVVAVHISDKEDMECEYIRPPSEASGLNASAAGPGLDSDFGASAGTPQTHTAPPQSVR